MPSPHRLQHLVPRQGTNKGITGPGLPYDFFIGWLWTGIAIATVFIIGRLCARILGPRRLYADDVFIFITWVLVVATGALWQREAANMYYILDLDAGLGVPGPDVWSRMHHFFRVVIAVDVAYYTGLVASKLSLLFFFRRLGNSIDRFRQVWWPVLIFCLCTYLVAIGAHGMDYQCVFGDTCDPDEATAWTSARLVANCVLDVVSDCLILIVPVVLLWGTRIHWKRKLAFLGLTSLSLVTIAVSITRGAHVKASLKSNGLVDSSYLWFWSSFHSFLCVAVTCSSAFPQLFMASKRGSKKKPAWSPTQSYYDRMILSFRSRRRRQDMDLFDATAATQTRDDLDHVAVQKGTADSLMHLNGETTIGSRDAGGARMEMMLVRGGPTPMAACYTGRGPGGGPAPVAPWQISRVQEYSVTKSSA